MVSSRILRLLVFYALHYSTLAQVSKVSFINFSEQPVQLFFLDESSDSEVPVADLVPYMESAMETYIGHSFIYYLPKERHVITVEGDTVYAIGPDTVQVVCSTSTGDFRAIVQPEWAPLGAGRFLELVQNKYFDGCGLNRVVKGFLTQFGISADYEMRTTYRTATIRDDVIPSQGKIAFQHGYMSYAGSGPNSRSNEMFIVMPDADDWALSNFGRENPWETPFGYVEPEDLSTVAKWEAYGDMPPWGKGPDPGLIYEEDGYEYLKREFPKLSYLHECNIISSTDVEGVEEL